MLTARLHTSLVRAARVALPATGTAQVRHFGVRHKVVDLDDALSVVRNGDTLTVSGFVGQGSPETLLRGLGERYENTGEPKDLTLLFGGGPGDWDSRGLNHLAKDGMLKRTIGAHYGQIPQVAKMVLENKIEAYNLPLGSVSRMIRCAAGAVPGHITKVGLGTFVDPRDTGGKINDVTTEDLVELITLDGEEYLRYKPIFPRVALIRATTGDTAGNLTLERESLLGDVREIAMATRSSGGIVVAQVERVAAHGSLPARSVAIPGAMVDCIVVAEPEEHHMSYFTSYNPDWSSEILGDMGQGSTLKLDARKVIARRAALELRSDDIVNLGIGMPEGVANVAFEEKIFPYVTLTTEPGVFGGVGASGVEFGPAAGAEAFQEMNQQFDFYNGGGLDQCFLGLAQCDEKGDVNVSRLSESSLVGPGGFIDITQCTRRVFFMGTFTKKGLRTKCEDGKLVIEQEGKIPTFSKQVREVTFSGKQAVANGQKVYYITERAVFRLTSKGLKLVEIAPGLDLDKDVLDLMDFEPIVDRDNVKTMDAAIFSSDLMKLYDSMFEVDKLVEDRLDYHADTHTLFADMSNFSVTSNEQVAKFKDRYWEILKEVTNNGANRVNVVANYDNFDCRNECTKKWEELVTEAESRFYKSGVRYTTKLFMRNKLGKHLHMLTEEELWSRFTKGEATLTRENLREALVEDHHLNLNSQDLNKIMKQKSSVEYAEFPDVLARVIRFERNHKGDA